MDDSGGVEWNCRRLPPPPSADGRLTTDIPPRSVTTYVVDVRDPRS
jgi:O-glycosyl hydrolase